MQVDLAGCDSIGALRETLEAHAQAHPDLEWIVGIHWDQTPWGRYPHRRDLDDFDLGGRPCFLWRACFHIGVANSRALELAGVTGAESIAGGIIDLDADCAPTGIIREAA
jgi:predicted amidohydrolase YtcJ